MEKDAEKYEQKKPTTFTEQVELYKTKKMQVKDSEFAENFLKRVNYYRLSAYRLTLKDPDPSNKGDYVKGTTFEQLVAIYEFDKKLRHLIVGVLENIEIAFRTHITYLIAHKYGALAYDNSENFSDESHHASFLQELARVIDSSKRGEVFIDHYYKKYDGQFPIWLVMEIMSFGMISKLYKNLKTEDKKTIAQTYYGIPHAYTESWLRTLSYVRNVCAHYGRLYNKTLAFSPRLFRETPRRVNKNKLFAAVYIAVRLLTEVEGKRFILDLEALIDEYKEYIDFSHIGFPTDWDTILSDAVTQQHKK